MKNSLATFVMLLGFAYGCGGNTESATGDGGQPSEGSSSDNELPGDTSAGDDSSSATDSWAAPPDGGPWSPVCPETAPTAGSPCTVANGINCEYGDAWWGPGCNTVFACASGSWTLATLNLGPCLPEPGPNPTVCPPDVPRNRMVMPCPVLDYHCNYGQGIDCSCTVAPASSDAGLAWSCPFYNPACPSSRPRLGSGCSTSLAGIGICTYLPIGFGESCENGVWK
jgi:hypothetical protein